MEPVPQNRMEAPPAENRRIDVPYAEVDDGGVVTVTVESLPVLIEGTLCCVRVRAVVEPAGGWEAAAEAYSYRDAWTLGHVHRQLKGHMQRVGEKAAESFAKVHVLGRDLS